MARFKKRKGDQVNVKRLPLHNVNQISLALIGCGAAMALFLVALNHDVIVANLAKPPRAPDNLWWIAGAFVVVTFAWTAETYWRFRRPSNEASGS